MKSFLRVSRLATLLALVGSTSPASNLAVETRTLVNLLEQAHYHRSEVKSSDFSSAIEDFMAELDGQRLFFLRGDHDAFVREHGATLHDKLAYRGDLSLVETIHSRYVERVRERVSWIVTRLGQNFNFDGDGVYEPDRSRTDWITTAKEADELWERQLTAELIREMVSGLSFSDAAAALRTRYEQFQTKVADSDKERMKESFLTSVARVYDARSNYIAPRNWDDSAGGSLNAGVGLLLDRRGGRIVVDEVQPGGPAARTDSIAEGDRVIAVGEKDVAPTDVSTLPLADVAKLTAGMPGTDVALVIEPADGAARQKTVLLTRAPIDPGASRVQGFVLEQRLGTELSRIGVVKCRTLYGKHSGPNGEEISASGDLKQILTQLETAKVGKLVLDLRGNGGGYFLEAIATVGLFIDGGPVVQVRNYKGKVEVESAPKNSQVFAGPMIVLVDRDTASGAEIIAGVLQAYGRALIVGNAQTEGIGSVQTILEMRNLVPALARSSEPSGGARFTVQMFFLPDGTSTETKGVKPDVLVLPESATPADDEMARSRARNVSPIAPVRIKAKPLPQPLIASLGAANGERQKTMPEFTAFRRKLELQHQARDVARSLNLERRRLWLETATSEEREAPSTHSVRVVSTLGAAAERVTANLERESTSDVMLLETLHILADLVRETSR